MLRIYSIIKHVAHKKGEWIYILSRKIKYYTKEILKLVNIMAIALFIIMAISFIKYKPVYQVTILGEKIGYTIDKQKLEERIKTEILQSEETNVAFITINDDPVYELKFIDRTQEIEEGVILAKLKEKAQITYKVYSITLDNETKSFVNTLEEAEKLVANIKEEYQKDLELNIGITEVYTEDLSNLGDMEFASAKTVISQDLSAKIDEKKKIESSTINGIYLSSKPVSGIITSRFGSRESIRTSAHKGLDIAAPNGTEIKAAADGTVIHSGNKGNSYGNYIILSHGNGVVTYYAHCSKLFVKEGQTVKSGDKIAAVGSTGRSTGNHLHFEIRLNNEQINPQKYIYK